MRFAYGAEALRDEAPIASAVLLDCASPGCLEWSLTTTARVTFMARRPDTAMLVG